MSWTGSEQQRKPQGVCSAPVLPANTQSFYTIPAGTRVEVRSIADMGAQWKAHTTKAEIGFERYETRNKLNRYYEFREQGFFVRVPSRSITFRK